MSFFDTDPTSTFDTPQTASTNAPKRHAVTSSSHHGSSAAQRRGIDSSPPKTDFGDQQLRDAVHCVAETIAPVWPRKDYVAVNPYLGLTERPFLSARQCLRSVSDCEMLMPLEYYRGQFDNGSLQESDINAAIQQIQADHSLFRITSADVLDQLTPATTTVSAHAASFLHAKRMRSVADVADSMDNTDWSNVIREEIGKHCAAYYDDAQAVWPSPWKHLPLFQAWRSASQQDRRFELLGATGFCRFVASLPHTPGAAIAFLLKTLQVPAELWESFLYCQALSIPGWSAWARYQTRQETDCADGEHFEALLAMRIAYDVGVAKATGLTID